MVEGGEAELEVGAQGRRVVVGYAGGIGAVGMGVVVREVGDFAGALDAGGGAVETGEGLDGETG